MLSTKVETTADLMSIALQAEREAVRRYTGLAQDMRDAGNESVAQLFERMAAEEREHERLLLEWMTRESIVENPDIGPVRWRDPQAATHYNDEARNPHYSTPYRALAFAVNNEENAFRFYTHVAAHANDEAVRQYAEILAREELGHAALLRAQRRLAYHAERNSSPTGPRLDPDTIHDEADLLLAAIRIDSYLVDAMERIASNSPLIAGLINETCEQMSAYRKTIETIAPDSAGPAGEIFSGDPAQPALPEAGLHGREAELQRLDNYCDRSFAFYDAVVDSTLDEAVMRSAQQLSQTALDRISVLKRASAERQTAASS